MCRLCAESAVPRLRARPSRGRVCTQRLHWKPPREEGRNRVPVRSRHIGALHDCGEMSLSFAAALEALGLLDKRALECAQKLLERGDARFELARMCIHIQ